MPYLSNLRISEDMENHELQPEEEEEEELIVLDSQNVCSFSFHNCATGYN